MELAHLSVFSVSVFSLTLLSWLREQQQVLWSCLKQSQTFVFCCPPQCLAYNPSLISNCLLYDKKKLWPAETKECSKEENLKHFSISIRLDRIQLLSNLHSQRIRTPESLSIFTHRLLSDAYWMCHILHRIFLLLGCLNPCSEFYNSRIRIPSTHSKLCFICSSINSEDQLMYTTKLHSWL